MLHLENILSKCIIGVLDKNNVNYSVEEQDGEYFAELEFYTDHDGDQVETVWFEKENSDESFANGLLNIYDSFDIDDYVLMWMEAKKNRPNVCPLNARQLVEDAEYIENFLDELSTQVYHAINNKLTA